MAIVLRASEMHWLGGATDHADQCPHGKVTLSQDERELVGPADGELTISAAALFLLRTLEEDHRPGHGVADDNQLFPCCGHVLYPDGDRCYISGCPNGVDISVTSDGDAITLRRDEMTITTTRTDWREAVLRFVRQVESFYSESESRADIADESDAAGWRSFWQEWRRRVEASSA